MVIFARVVIRRSALRGATEWTVKRLKFVVLKLAHDVAFSRHADFSEQLLMPCKTLVCGDPFGSCGRRIGQWEIKEGNTLTLPSAFAEGNNLLRIV